MFYVLLLYLSDWISMVSVCVGLWIWNVCVWYCVYGSGVSSLVSACVNPRGSLSSLRVVAIVVSSLVISPSFSLRRFLCHFSFVLSCCRRLLRRSSPSPLSRDLHLSLGLRPSTFGSSSVVLVVCWALAWTLDRRRGVLSQMQGFALRGGILAVTFVRRSLVFITIME
jgi:hypothetical protein